MTRWRTEYRTAPDVGALVPQAHAVWRVLAVEFIDLDDEDREKWLEAGMPDLEGWRLRPYEVRLEFVGGLLPDAFREQELNDVHPTHVGSITIHARNHHYWDIYPGGRWPQCSCCGEPMPCRGELADRQVDASMEQIAKLESRLPGTCWECGEPITRRQRTVTYPGDNLDLPGALAPTFHRRAKCSWKAAKYEERWLVADPRRERVLTYPRCAGTLYVHADGSSECYGGDLNQDPPCQGHLTHDHGSYAVCHYLTHGCPKGCGDRHGCRPSRRPDRTQPTTLGGGA